MYHVEGSIRGIAPILFNRPYQEPARIKTEDDRRKLAAAQRLYRDDERGVFLPKWTFKRMLSDGCARAGLKIKRASLIPFLQATLYLDADPTFGKMEADFLHEVWGRVPPKRGPMVKVWRPAMEVGWTLRFAFRVFDDIVDAEQVREALATAGLLVGLGAWRPEYGRFVVDEWNVTRE